MAGLAADALTLADKAQSPYRIVIPADAVPAERYAAAELQHYLEAMSGAKLPIVSDGEPRGDREIVLGASNRRIADLGLKPDSVRLGADGFWLKTASSALVVAGGGRAARCMASIPFWMTCWECGGGRRTRSLFPRFSP